MEFLWCFDGVLLKLYENRTVAIYELNKHDLLLLSIIWLIANILYDLLSPHLHEGVKSLNYHFNL